MSTADRALSTMVTGNIIVDKSQTVWCRGPLTRSSHLPSLSCPSPQSSVCRAAAVSPPWRNRATVSPLKPATWSFTTYPGHRLHEREGGLASPGLTRGCRRQQSLGLLGPSILTAFLNRGIASFLLSFTYFVAMGNMHESSINPLQKTCKPWKDTGSRS